MACFLIFFLGAISAEKPPFWLVLYFIILPACVIVGVIIALMQRLREIKGGEEDAARKY
jgi:type III secretory pathway component EscS